MNLQATNDENLHQEILLSTDINSQLSNIFVWDYDSGSSILSYNNCSVTKNSVGFIKQDYMLCAIHQKPFIYCWNLKNRSQQFTKITCSGIVNALSVSTCGNYIAIGIEEKCFIWQTYSGKTVSVLSQHFQKITKILFGINDQFVITSSEDGLILVWNFHEILTQKMDYVNPTYKLNAHSLSINDIFVSKTSDRLLSVAVDQSCKLWNLLNGSVISSILFNVVPTKVIFDNLENNIYVAFINGTIGHLTIKTLLNESNKIMNENQYGVFTGHKQKINCLAVSLDDSSLASGSDDLTIRIWDTLSRQCIKILNHNGVVTNLEFKIGLTFFSTDKSQITPLPTRYYADSDFNSENTITKLIKEEKSHQTLKLSDFINNNELNDNHDEYFELKNKFDNVKQINEKIYNYTLNEILK